MPKKAESASFSVEIIKHDRPPRRNLPYRVVCQNETGFLTLIFFRAQGDWLTRALPFGSRRIVSGRVERFRNQLQIAHPDHMLPEEEFAKLPPMEPVYRLTAGLAARPLMKAIQAALPDLPKLPEWQDPKWLEKTIGRAGRKPSSLPIDPTALMRCRHCLRRGRGWPMTNCWRIN